MFDITRIDETKDRDARVIAVTILFPERRDILGKAKEISNELTGLQWDFVKKREDLEKLFPELEIRICKKCGTEKQETIYGEWVCIDCDDWGLVLGCKVASK